MFSGDPDGASHRCLAAAAERKAIDRRDHRLAEIFNQIEHALTEAAGFLRLIGIDMCEFTDVSAGDEGLVARAGEDHAVHRRVGLCILEGSPQIGPGRRIERVEHLGPIDRHVGDRTLFLVLDVRKRQRRPRQRGGCCCRRRGERCSLRSHDHISWMGGGRLPSTGRREVK